MTIEPPDTLPEGWVGKPKDDYPGRRSGCFTLTLLMLVFLVLVGAAALFIYDPSIIQKILDYPNLPQTQQALDLTAQFNQQFATDIENSVQQRETLYYLTQSALAAREASLYQTATQAAAELMTTQTSSAQELSALQMEAALNLQATLNAYSLLLAATESVGAASGALTQQAIQATATWEEFIRDRTATAEANATPPASQP